MRKTGRPIHDGIPAHFNRDVKRCSPSRQDMICLTAIGLTPGGSSTVHIYTQTIHSTTQSTQTIHRTTQLTNWEECGPWPVFATHTLAFALKLRKKSTEKSQSG